MSTSRCAFAQPSLAAADSIGDKALPEWSYLNAFAGVLISYETRGERTHCRFLADTGDIVEGAFTGSSDQCQPAAAATRVIAVVPAKDVVVVAPGYWSIDEQWNQWAGRIVLVETWNGMPIMTAKVIGRQWTIKTVGPVIGRECRPRVWDAVTIAIDPGKISVKSHQIPRPSLRPRLLKAIR